MERKGNAHRKKKRTRDEGDDKRKEYPHKGKKQEIVVTSSDNDSSYRKSKRNGVFDFPWLKEGSVFEMDEFLKPEDHVFAPCSCLGEEDNTLVANLDQPCLQNSLASDRNFDVNKFDGGSLCSFGVDDFEPLDCIWSSIIDQPLDNICPNKT
ncbi:hypothetical protein ABFS82_08G157400 [Erythranthe guttata]|uniref:Uncharacterized protein n=1 Tax=Erythranthe guttata TaxID=4155 RepID=A0A022R4T0_ERYGU|nr:hypothetical protein MIMGU_mgv1a015631mg [Erythranthe guttata]